MPGADPDAAGRRSAARSALAGLPPASFGVVMATGIIAIAAGQLGLAMLARALFVLNVGLYILLCVLYAARLALYPARFRADLTDHRRAPGFFTAVAGSGVLGSQFMLLGHNAGIAVGLWVVTMALWVALTYGIFLGFTTRLHKPTLGHGVNGGWLLAVVGTQSIAVLTALLAAQPDCAHPRELNFFALSMWLAGGMLYVWIVVLIFYRWTFLPVAPRDLAPPYWINMGAMAISTLAGALLAANAPHAPWLHALRPFVDGITILCWATGTWWIPLLLALSLWRHVRRRYPLRYNALSWGAVFPLGMYAASTFEMARSLELHFLDGLPPVFFAAALLAWAASLGGMLRGLAAQRSRLATRS